MKIMGTVADFEVWVELNGVRIAGTCDDFVLTADSIGGLGLPEVKATDLNRLDGHGSVGGVDYGQARQIFFPIAFQRPSAREAMSALRELKAAWAPKRVDNELAIYMPGIGPSDDILRFYGRPRSTLDVIMRALPGGVISAFATFVALDPVGYGPEETASGTTTVVVDNEGDADSRRAVIEIVGNGSRPSVVNASDNGRDVRFRRTLGVGQSWFIDLYRQTVTNASGASEWEDNLLPSSLWPKLVPGENVFEIAGAASATVTYQTGWW